MLDQVSRYESYRDSGVDWIGEVPSDWTAKRLKFLFRERNARTRTGQETLYSLRMNEGLVPHDHVSDKPIAPEDLIDYKLIAPGQVVMNRMRAAIGIFGVAPAYGLVSPDYAIFDVDPEVDAQFFLRVFKTTLMGIRFRLASKGMGTGSQGFMRLYTEEFGDIKVAVPPLETQREIVKAVDEKTAEIDEAIGKKRRLIELLNEQKAILINRAATRGLDPSAPMKDSGVDWIGEIPAHWEVKRVKHICKSIGTGRTPPSDIGYDVFEEGVLNWYTPGDFQHRGVFGSAEKLLNERAVQQGLVEVYPPDSLYFVGIGGTLGRVCLSRSSASCNQQFNVLSFLNGFSPDYAMFLLTGWRQTIFDLTNYTTMPILNQSGTKNLPVLVPPYSEQIEIVENANSISSRYGETIGVADAEIEALNEFKQTLIANAVTGKIKI